jgi:predicted metalloendopeptidase
MLEWSTTEELNQLRKVPERDVWLMHPAIVNAWYSPNHNTISKMWFSRGFRPIAITT